LKNGPFKMGFLMDPIDRISPDKDTTFVFMMEAQKRGHEILYFTPERIYATAGTVRAVVIETQVERGEPHYSLGDSKDVDLAELDAVFFRTDPPFTIDYLFQTYLLDIASKNTFVTNNPSSVRAANEKLFALQFHDLTPPHMVTSDAGRIKDFMIKNGGKIVVKPLDRAGGEGVFAIESGDRNTNAILETSTNFGKTRIIAQKYIPEVRNGDKRILLLDGEFLGATLRVPAEDENRANIHVGGDCVRYELDDRDKMIIDRVGPELKKRGLHFVGLDVLGDMLTEINVTSPTGIQEIDRLQNVALETKVIDFVEHKIFQAAHRS